MSSTISQGSPCFFDQEVETKASRAPISVVETAQEAGLRECHIIQPKEKEELAVRAQEFLYLDLGDLGIFVKFREAVDLLGCE